MCRPFQEHGVCKYGEKCQFAHGTTELRTVNRHPKYKTDMCRTYHSVGFCPYGPRCHFIHSLDEMRSAPASPDKKANGAGSGNAPIKQLPMFGGSHQQQQEDLWSSSNNSASSGDSTMKSAVAQLNNFFNMAGSANGGGGGGRNGLLSSVDSSRSGSFCSDIMESHSPASGSPPPSAHSSLCTSPIDVSRSLRLPIFNRLA
jgi:tristetraprolin